MDTQVLDIGPSPARIDSPDGALGEPGQRCFAINVGDDAVHWLVAASQPTAGQPGFPIRRGQRIELSLSDASQHGLWAWSRGRSRLVLSVYPDDVGAAPGSTGIITIGATPIQIPDPAGASAGDAYIAYNVGGEAFTLQAPTTPSPDIGEGGIPLDVGASLPLTVGSPGATSSVWAWSPKGAVLLTTLADARWRL